MNSAHINNELMILANFYGTIAASNGILPETVTKCNTQLSRILLQLEKATDQLISAASGIIIENGQER